MIEGLKRAINMSYWRYVVLFLRMRTAAGELLLVSWGLRVSRRGTLGA